ncbi:hypothetical protein OD800_21870 [Pseudomonas aeruginosa]|uniref:hypothetical protein n=1 Tax=Pseudomonas aeruginosa TaxID=287 RepID=UPI00129E2DAA|nr:hypothetical protein [Pseudomonas aeruginosa]EKV4565929.1 hypothetical protein [Pseudomonas aeruginosa]MBH8875626.1 hypothetical protein [Pseudomonas aeruginosa]MBI8967775.1 hypothetical protein [Pseudomonas aeruginosa]MBU8394079.1 hypothetical protein [Pseudomonas aeruginosa]MBY1010882.1 hypothetical protein [Pseudomonas aeruginosa]
MRRMRSPWNALTAANYNQIRRRGMLHGITTAAGDGLAVASPRGNHGHFGSVCSKLGFSSHKICFWSLISFFMEGYGSFLGIFFDNFQNKA